MIGGYRFTDKDPNETVTLGIDFARLLISGETISSPTVTLEVIAGEDAAPEDMLASSPSVAAGRVSVLITGGVDGCEYMLVFLAPTSQGNLYLEAGYLRVKSKP